MKFTDIIELVSYIICNHGKRLYYSPFLDYDFDVSEIIFLEREAQTPFDFLILEIKTGIIYQVLDGEHTAIYLPLIQPMYILFFYRRMCGLSRPRIRSLLHIPIRSLENWELGYTTPPEYVALWLTRFLQSYYVENCTEHFNKTFY